MRISFNQLKNLVLERAPIQAPTFSEKDKEAALEVLSKIYLRANFLGLRPRAYKTSSKWNGWSFFAYEIPEYRTSFMLHELAENVREWISDYGMESILRADPNNNWVMWPANGSPNGNHIRALARKYSGNDPRITEPYELPYKGLKIQDNKVVDYVGKETSLVIPDGVVGIENYVFNKHSELREIELPSTLTEIGTMAFAYSGIEEIELPDSVVTIGWYAFSHCKNLRRINVPKSIEKNGFDYVLDDCPLLDNIKIPDSVDLGSAISNIDVLQPIYNESKTILYRVPTAFSGEFVIPETVEKINDSVFKNCKNITSVIIPNSVTSIESNAFNNCTNLTHITIPNTITSIGSWAFEDCIKLKTIAIPNSVTSIGGSAFLRCAKLTSVTIPNSVTRIGGYAFGGCSGLTSVMIGNGVTSIGNYAFDGCNNLTSVTIPDSVTSIGYHAFQSCSSLTSITIPDSVTSIGYCAFDRCSSLTSVTIPDSVTSIDWGAFGDCTSLERVRLPKSLFETIIKEPNKWFENTPWAKKVLSGEILFDVDVHGTLDKYNGHDSVISIPNDVSIIGAGAFFGNERIRKVTIPSSVSTIESGAFEDCDGLETIVIGIGVKRIEKDAFKNVSKKITVYVPNFDMCKLLIESGLPDSATIVVGSGKSRRRVLWDPED